MKRLATALAVAAMTTAAVGGTFDLSWFTVDCGGLMNTGGGSYELSGTVGQPDAGVLTGGDFTLTGGFWGVATTPVSCPGDADGDNDVDISDLGLVLSQFGMTGMGLAGDVDFDDDVDISDLGLLLANFGVNCP